MTAASRPPLIHEVLPVGQLQCNCSVLGDPGSRDAIVVDPGDDIPRILAVLAKHGLTPRQIVVTHAHIDHIAGAAQLKCVTGAPILYNPDELMLVAMMDTQAAWLGVPTPEVYPPDDALREGRVLHAGGSDSTLTASVIETPGHTPGSVCLHLPQHELLLAGDTLFAGAVGRTDLPGGDMRRLLSSIREKLLQLPETTRVLPGHGSATTIGQERETNPFLV